MPPHLFPSSASLILSHPLLASLIPSLPLSPPPFLCHSLLASLIPSLPLSFPPCLSLSLSSPPSLPCLYNPLLASLCLSHPLFPSPCLVDLLHAIQLEATPRVFREQPFVLELLHTYFRQLQVKVPTWRLEQESNP